MSTVIKPGAGVLYMKVGKHATESLEDIIARKTKEIKDEGYGMWGYGGNTCHPSSMVQPFVGIFEERGLPIHLVMQAMNSKHDAAPERSEDFSVDGRTWQKIPSGIHVLGSKFALVIKSLEVCEFDLPLNQTRVPVGKSAGRLGSRYVRGQVDKACLEVIEQPEIANEEDVKTAPSI
jgi:hypothetical protein